MLLLLAALQFGPGCAEQTDPCPEKNLVVVVNMAESVEGDELYVDVLNGQTLVHHGVVKRPPSGTRGRIEVNLGDDYVPGAGFRVYVSPVSDRAVRGRAEGRLELGPVCSRIELTVTNVPPEPDWSCVGMIDLVTHRTGALVNNQFQFTDMFNKGIPSASIDACADWDAPCSTPYWRGEIVNGVAKLGIDNGFEGFFKVVVNAEDFLPVEVDVTRAVGIMNARPVIVLLQSGTMQELATVTRAELLLGERGYLTLATFDCRGYRVGGVSLSFKANPVEGVQPQLYILANNWYPDDKLDATDDTGTAVIANLPPGIVGITAVHKASGKVISRFNTRIAVGVMSYVAVEPN